MRRNFRKAASLVTAVTMVISASPVTSYAVTRTGDHEVVIKEGEEIGDTGDHDTVYGDVKITEDDEIAENYGSVDKNDEDMTIDKNLGKVEDNEGIINQNLGEVGDNKGIVYTNGSEEEDDNYNRVNEGAPYIENNYGGIRENHGNVDTNKETGYIEENNGTGYIDTNDGSVKKNYGTIKENNSEIEVVGKNRILGGVYDNEGSIKTNNGDVLYNKEGYVGTNNGVVYSNSAYGLEEGEFYAGVENNAKKGVVVDNSGLIGNNYGLVKNNYSDAVVIANANKVETNQGVIIRNYGTVDKNQSDDYDQGIIYNYGEVTENDGYIGGNHKDVGTNTGLVDENFGNVATNNGDIGSEEFGGNYGVVSTNNGTVYINTGKILENKGKVIDNAFDGIVGNYAGGTIAENNGTVYNLGGKVTKNIGTEYFSVSITGGGNTTQQGGKFATSEDYDGNWLGTTGTTQSSTTIKITPNDGFKIEHFSIPTEYDKYVKAFDNGDGTWTLEVKSGLNIKLSIPDASKPVINVEPEHDNQDDYKDIYKADVNVNPVTNQWTMISPANGEAANNNAAVMDPAVTPSLGDGLLSVDLSKYTESLSTPEAMCNFAAAGVQTLGTENIKGTGTIDFKHAFDGMEVGTLNVPVTADVKNGITYRVILNNGDTADVVCSMDGVLSIPVNVSGWVITYIIYSLDMNPSSVMMQQKADITANTTGQNAGLTAMAPMTMSGNE